MNELADIIDPTSPITAADTSVAWSMALVVLIALIAAVVVWWRRNAARRRALRRVRQLRIDVAHGRISARELAYRVAAELRSGLRTPRLRATDAPAVDSARQQSWRELVAHLDVLRYQSGAQLDAAQLNRLLRDSAHWLRRAR